MAHWAGRAEVLSRISMAATNNSDADEKWIDLTDDGGVKKKILVEGKGDTPVKDSDVFCHYVSRLASNGQQIDSSRDRDSEFNFPIGRGVVIKGWDIGIQTMKKGETSILRCSPEYAYGEVGTEDGDIPPNSTLDFEIELIRWTVWKRVQSNNNLQKQILKRGIGNEYETPFMTKVTKCIVSYIGRINDPKTGPVFCQADNIVIYPIGMYCMFWLTTRLFCG